MRLAAVVGLLETGRDAARSGCGRHTASGSCSAADSAQSTQKPMQMVQVDLVAFLAEVLVEVAVKDGICAGRRAADEVADGEEQPEEFVVFGEQREGIAEQVEQVERQPAKAEDERDAYEHCVRSLYQVQLSLLLTLQLSYLLAPN